MDEQQTSQRFDLERALLTLRRRWWWILLCVALAAGSTAAFSVTREKEYSASASLLFRESNLDQSIIGTSFQGSGGDPEREAATNVKLVSSPEVAARTSRTFRGRLSPSAVSGKIEVEAEGQSNVVSVKATDTRPAFASRLANAYARQFIEFRQEADRAGVLRAQAVVQRQLDALSDAARASPEGQALQTRSEQLKTLASLQTGNAEIVHRARVPDSPSSPNTRLNVVVGGFLGLLFGLGLAILAERLNRRLKEPDEVGEMYGLPVLVQVPESDALEDHEPPGRELPEAEWEAFRMLRARLRYFNVDREVRSVLVISCGSQEGKSTVAWHLAAATAMSPDAPRVLLVEADLRAPSLGQDHGLRLAPGLSEALADAQPFTSVIQEVPIGDGRREGDPPATMDVLVAGAVPPNPAELLDSQRMMEMLKTLDAMYDFIVLDSAPSLLVSDSMPLLGKVDGVLVVSRVGTATRDSAARLRDELRALRAPVLGVVANRVKTRSRDLYGYGYSYSFGARAKAPMAGGNSSAASSDGETSQPPDRPTVAEPK